MRRYIDFFLKSQINFSYFLLSSFFIGFGGYRESGFGRDGGKEGLYEYVRPIWKDRPRPSLTAGKVTRGAEEGGGGWSVSIPDFGKTVQPRPVLPRKADSSTSSSSSSSSGGSGGEGGPLSVIASPIRFHLASTDYDSDSSQHSDGKMRTLHFCIFFFVF